MAPQVEELTPLSAQANMDYDHERLLALTPNDAPRLSFYQWEKPSITYGYFTKPESWLDIDALERAGYSLGKRPTGGGVIFHTDDVAFSVLIPKGHPKLSENTLENYRLVNSVVMQAVSKALDLAPEFLAESTPTSSFCMAEPTIYDVMAGGKKVGGAAQRRGKQGLLHQGTIALSVPSEATLKAFIKDSAIVDKIISTTYPLRVSREKLLKDLKDAFLTLLAE
ncbi:MAG: hypothetical protein KDK62_04415 [Chlamydiia bacterium]|nr:hypothetical protein [Chlamydiia bacterium]